MQRPNRFDLDQKIKINSKKNSRGVESFKSSKNKLCRCRNEGKLKITQLFLTRLLLTDYICHNYTTIYGSLYTIYGRWPNLSAHVKKTPSILHQSKNPLEEWFLLAKGAFLLKNFLQSWTGPCITPSPCINVTFPPFTTKNIEVFCALHAVNSSS